jgi:hypothetical protein
LTKLEFFTLGESYSIFTQFSCQRNLLGLAAGDRWDPRWRGFNLSSSPRIPATGTDPVAEPDAAWWS